MCLWYGNDENTDGHVRDNYTDALILFYVLICGSWLFCILLHCYLLIYKGCPRSFATRFFYC